MRDHFGFRKGSDTSLRLLWVALAALLVGADIIWTPHSPVSYLPQIGIYLLVTLGGTGAVLGVTLLLKRVLCRREDYYVER
ncbi:MAG: hypothetical protein WC913_10340 [Desulfuromonas sp.]